MKKWKKVLSIICCLTLLLTMVPAIGATDSSIDEDNLYRPNPMCGTCLGKNADGVYEFEITIANDFENQPTPLLPGPFYSNHEIVKTGDSAGTTEDVISSRSCYFYGCNPGTADISYSASSSSSGPKVLKAIVHVTVLSQEDYDAFMDSESTPAAQDHIHSWSYKWDNPTCTKGGVFSRYCSRCKSEETLKSCEPVDHMYRVYVTREPTLDWDGERTYTCTYCNYKYTEVIPKLESPSDDTPNTTPDTTPTTTPSTTTQPSSPCANGHTWSAIRTTAKATCTQEGRNERVCTVCGKTETSVIPETGHSWTSKTEPATTEKDGKVYRVCSICGTDETVQILPKIETQKPQQAQTVDANAGSGSTSMSKLSKQEIIDLLNAAPTTMPSDIFTATPSCTAPYATGKVKQEVLDAAAARLSALRRIAGLPSVTTDPALCEQAQYGAVILGKLGTLSHTPSRPADMDNAFYQKAYDATSSSNIFAGLNLLSTPDGFMDDSDAGNIDRVGHRRWQLNPVLGKVGFGYVDSGNGYGRFTTEKVFDQSGKNIDYNYIAWPASGNFPNDLSAFENNTAWSVSLNPAYYAEPMKSNIKVTLTRGSDNKQWILSGQQNYQASGSGQYFNVQPQYWTNYGGNHCIIFRPDGIEKYEGIYTVEITGLKDAKGTATNLSYQVDFFPTKQSTSTNQTNPITPTNPTIPTTPTTPTNPTTTQTQPHQSTETKIANPTNDKLTVNGVAQSPTIYKIGGNNYFKLRDVAALLNGTAKQFNIGYNNKKVAVTAGQSYEATGNELNGIPANNRSAISSNDSILINNIEANLTVYKIDGSNYFKLRDLGKALNFYVGWTPDKIVYIKTDKPYTE